MKPGDLVRVVGGRWTREGVYATVSTDPRDIAIGDALGPRWEPNHPHRRFIPAGTVLFCVSPDVDPPGTGLVTPATFLHEGEVISAYEENFEVINAEG